MQKLVLGILAQAGVINHVAINAYDGYQNDLCLPGATNPRIRFPWLAAIVQNVLTTYRRLIECQWLLS